MDSYDPRVFSCPGTIPTNLLSKAGLQPSQALPARFKFLVTRTNLKPIVEALLFLRKSCVGRIGALKLKVAENTVSARADDLCHFYQYLDSEGLPLEDIEPDDLFNYVGSMYGMVSPTTNKVYAKATIIRRLSTIRPFILFCQNQGWLKNRFEVETRVVDGKAREILEPDLVYELIEPADRRVKHIPANDLQYLMDALGCWTELGEQAPAAGPRNRLIGEVALQTGLRRTEVTSLKSRHFQDVTLEGRSDFSTITVPVLGKGNKWRDVR